MSDPWAFLTGGDAAPVDQTYYPNVFNSQQPQAYTASDPWAAVLGNPDNYQDYQDYQQPAADPVYQEPAYQPPPSDIWNALTGVVSGAATSAGNSNPVDSYATSIWDAITQPWEEPTKQNMAPWEAAGDIFRKSTESVLGGAGTAMAPAGGLVDNIADSDIPGLNVAGGAVRNIWEQTVEPAGNFITAEMGALSRGGNVLDMLHGAGPAGWLVGGIGDLIQGRDPTQYYKDVAGALPQTNLWEMATDPNARAGADDHRSEAMKDAYDQALASGMTEDQARKKAERAGMKLVNPLNLAEEEGMAEFSQLPAWAQLILQFSNKINPGNEIFDSAVSGPKLYKGNKGDYHVFQNEGGSLEPVGALQAGAGKVAEGVGGGANALADVTGTRPFWDKLGNAIEGPQKAYSKAQGEGEHLNQLFNEAEQFTGDIERAREEVLLNPDSRYYYKTQGISDKYAEKAIEAMNLVGAFEAEGAAKASGGPTTTRVLDGEKLPNGEVQLGRIDQDTSPGAEDTLFAQATSSEGTTYTKAPDGLPGEALPFERQRDAAIADLVEQRAKEMKDAQPRKDLTQGQEDRYYTDLARKEAETAGHRDKIQTPEDLKNFRADNLPPAEMALKPNKPGMDTFDQTFSKSYERGPAEIKDYHRAIGIPERGAAHGDFVNFVNKSIGYERKAFKFQDGKKIANPKLVETKPLEQLGAVGAVFRTLNKTMPYLSRSFLNTSSRAVRDSISNVIKYVSEGFDTRDVSRADRIMGESGTRSMGRASADADIDSAGKTGWKSAVYFHATNPFNELSSDILRTLSKKYGKGEFKDWNDFTEKAESSMKTRAYKQEFLRRWDRAIDERVRSGAIDKIVGDRLKQGNLTKDFVSDYIKDKLPKGASLEQMEKGIYNPSHYSDTLREKYSKIFADQAGEIGGIVHHELNHLSDRVKKYNDEVRKPYDAEKKRQDALPKPKDMAESEARVKKLDDLYQKPITLNDVKPGHKLWDEMKRDIQAKFDTANETARVQEAINPELRKAVAGQIDEALKWTAESGKREALKRFIDSQQGKRKEYYKKYEANRPTTAEPEAAAKPAKATATDEPGQRKLLKEVLEYSKRTSPKNPSPAMVRAQIIGKPFMGQKPLEGRVVFMRTDTDGAHFRRALPDQIRKGEEQVWPVKQAEDLKFGAPGSEHERVYQELRKTGYNAKHTEASMGLMDAFANTWAKANNATPEDWYKTISFKKGEAVGAGALKQTVNIRRGLEPQIEGVKNAKTVDEARKELRAWTDLKYGPATTPDEQIKRFLEFGKAELKYQRGHASNTGKDWYTTEWKEAIEHMKTVFPEFKTDTGAAKLFKVLMGITSQRETVFVNAIKTIDAFEMYSRTGKIPLKKMNGKNYGMPIIAIQFGKLQNFLDTFYPDNWEAGLDWLAEKHTYEEMVPIVKRVINDPAPVLKDIRGDIESDVYIHRTILGAGADYVGSTYGSSFLGPKIGNFVANLNGAPDRVTKDQWFTETWNRYMGYLGDDKFLIAPKDDAQAQVMDKAMVELVKDLQAEGMEINLPQAQALLWYYEQQLMVDHSRGNAVSDSYGTTIKRAVENATRDGLTPGRQTPDTYRYIGRRASEEGTVTGEVRGDDAPSRQEGSVFNQETVDGKRVLGTTEVLNDGRYLISIFDNANASTVPHELAHVFRRYLDPALLKAAEDWAGITDGKWTVDHEEQFARGFEKYMREGRAPTPALVSVFQQFRLWLTNIYQKITGSEIAIDIKKARPIFDQMLGGDPAKAPARAKRAAEGEAREMGTPEKGDLLAPKETVVEPEVQEAAEIPGPSPRKPAGTANAPAGSKVPDYTNHTDIEKKLRVMVMAGGRMPTNIDKLRNSPLKDRANGEQYMTQLFQAAKADGLTTKKISEVVDFLKREEPTILKQEEAAPAEGVSALVGWREQITKPPAGKTYPVGDRTGTVRTPAELQKIMRDWNRFELNENGDPFTKADKKRAYRDMMATDEHIREVTNNTFKLDPDTMSMVRISDGKFAQELLGGKAPQVIGEARPKWPDTDPPNEPEKVVEEVKKYFGKDAYTSFAELEKKQGKAAVDQAISELAVRLGFPDPTNLNIPTEKTGLETSQGRIALRELERDARQRYNDAATQQVKLGAEEAVRDHTARDLEEQIRGVQAGVRQEADRGAYDRVEGIYFDYRNKNVLDQMLGSVLPFNYWGRRNFAYLAKFFANNPVQFAAILQFYKNIEQENQEAGDIAPWNMGNILLWTNPDGSKVQWNFSSLMPFNPAGSSDSMMQLIGADDDEEAGQTTSNKSPMAVLFGADREYNGKVTGRDKGIIPTFITPNPVFNILTQTGLVNKWAKEAGLVTDGFMSPDPSDKRAQRMTMGLFSGRTAVRDLAARTGFTDWVRKQLEPTGIKMSDLDIEGPFNNFLFGMNAGKPLTATYNELEQMAQNDPKNQEKYLWALAKLKEGNWTPEALKALDAVESGDGWRRLVNMAGFTAVVNNTPREQLNNYLGQEYGRVKDDKGHFEVTSKDPKTGYETRKLVEGKSQKYFDENAGASVMFAKNKEPNQIVESIGNTRTGNELEKLNKAYYDDKKMDLRTYNKLVDDLRKGNPTFFKTDKDKEYQQAKGELPYLPGADKKTVAEVDAKWAKTEIKSEREYAEFKDDMFRAGGSGRYSELYAKADALYDKGDKKGAYAIYDSPEYLKLKNARTALKNASPALAERYAKENGTDSGTTSSSSSGTKSNTGSSNSSSSSYRASSSKPYTTYSTKSSYTPAKKSYTTTYKPSSSTGSKSTASRTTSPTAAKGATNTSQTEWGKVEKQAYAMALADGFTKSYATSVANKIASGESQGYKSKTTGQYAGYTKANPRLDADGNPVTPVTTPSTTPKKAAASTGLVASPAKKTTIANANSSGYTKLVLPGATPVRHRSGGGGGGGSSTKKKKTSIKKLGSPYKVGSPWTGVRFANRKRF